MELKNLSISQIMVHVVHKRDANKQVVPPDYSNALTGLDKKGISTLQQRITSALGTDSHGVELEIVKEDDASFLQLTGQLLDASNSDYVQKSKSAADKLAEAQTSRQIPGGAVVVIRGTVGVSSRRFICTIKAETQDGFHSKHDGGKIILEHVTDLLLTPQQKLYKIGMFIEQKKTTPGALRKATEFIAYVFDHNVTQRETGNAARYFYESYLGCAIPESAKKRTRDFYNATREFINSIDLGSEEKVDLYNSLYTYLKVDSSNIISVAQFGEKYVPLEHQSDYLKYLDSKGIPNQSVPKDIEYIEGKLKRRRLRFSSSVQLIAPSDKFDELIKVIDEDDNSTTLKVRGKVSAAEA